MDVRCPARRPRHAGGDHVGPLRRPPARMPPLLPRSRERAGQSEACPARPARGPLRARGRRGRLAQRGSATGGERAAGAPGPQAPGRIRPRLPRPPQHRHPGHGGRAGALAAAGRGHGLARVRPHRRGLPPRPTGDRWVAGHRHVRPVRRRLRSARQLRARPARVAGPARRDRCCAASGWPSAAAGWAPASTGPTPGRRPSGSWPPPASSRPWSSWPGPDSVPPGSTHRSLRWPGPRCRSFRPWPSPWPPWPRWPLPHRCGAANGRGVRVPPPTDNRWPPDAAGIPRPHRRAGMIEFDRVSVTYTGADHPALREVCLRVEEGELALVVGRTGVGKSTLLGAVNGLVPHFTGGTLTGRVTVDGRDTRTHPPRELADVVGVVGQDPALGLRDRHGRRRAGLRHGATGRPARRHAQAGRGDPRPAGHRRPARPAPLPAVGGPATTGGHRFGADRSAADSGPRRAHLGTGPERRRRGAGRRHPARSRPRGDGGAGRAPARAGRPVRRSDHRDQGGRDRRRRPSRRHAADDRGGPAGGRTRPPGPVGPAAPFGARRPPGGGAAPGPALVAPGSTAAAAPRLGVQARPCSAPAISSSATDPSSPCAVWTSTWPAARSWP